MKTVLLVLALGACAETSTAPPSDDDGSGGEGGSAAGGGTSEQSGGAGGGRGGAAGAAGSPAVSGPGGAAGAGAGGAGKTGGHDGGVVAGDAGLDAAMAAYDPCPTNGSPCKIMPLGDSNTMIPGYRVALFRKARAANKSMTYVGGLTDQSPNMVDGVPFPRGHEGHNGNNIDGLRGLVRTQLMTYQPHIVLLMIGTNDTHRSSNVATAPMRLGLLVDAIAETSPQALIVVAKIVPSKADPSAQYYSAGHNDRIRVFNDALGPVLEQRRAANKHVVVVDMFAAFMAAPSYKALMGDNLHPNSAGFAVMADVWWDAIAFALK